MPSPRSSAMSCARFNSYLLFGIVATLAVCDRASHAAIIDTFDPMRHDRLLSNGTPNPSFLVDQSQLSGVGLGRGVLISPRHFITATHVSATEITLLGNDGQLRTYQSTSSQSLITAIAGQPPVASDIRIHTLATEVDASIEPVPIVVGDLGALIGQTVIAFDQFTRGGLNTIDALSIVEFESGNGDTLTIQFSYDTAANGGSGGLGGDEIGLLGGDSGHAALIDIGGRIGLLGTHMAIDVPAGASAAAGDRYDSFSSLVGGYEDQIRSIVGADGYSIQVLSLSAVPEPHLLPMLLMSSVTLALRRNRKPIAASS